MSPELARAYAEAKQALAAEQEATKRERIADEMAAGQTAPPTFRDKIAAALNPSLDPGGLAGDVYRAAKGLQSGITLGGADAFNDAVGLDSFANRENERRQDPLADATAHAGGNALTLMGAPGKAVGGAADGLAGMIEQRVPAMAGKHGQRVLGMGKAAAIGYPVGMSEAAGQGVTDPRDLLAAGTEMTALSLGIPAAVEAVGAVARAPGRAAAGLSPALKRYGEQRAAGKYGEGPGGVSRPGDETQMHAATAETLDKIRVDRSADMPKAGKDWVRMMDGESEVAAPHPGPEPAGPPPAPPPSPEALARLEALKARVADIGRGNEELTGLADRIGDAGPTSATLARDALARQARPPLPATPAGVTDPWASVPAVPRPVRSPEAVARSAAGTPIDDGSPSPISIPDSEVQIADTPVDKHAALRAHLGNVIEEINAEFANRTPVDPYAGGLPRGAPKVPPAIARQAPSLRRPPLADTPVDSGAGRLGALERLLRAETDRGGGGSQEFTPVQAATPGRTGDTPTAYPPTAPPPPMSHFSMAGLTPVVPAPDVPSGLFPGNTPVFEPPPAPPAPSPAAPAAAPPAAVPPRGRNRPIDHSAYVADLQKARTKYLNDKLIDPDTGRAMPMAGNDAIVGMFDKAINRVVPGNTIGDIIKQRQAIGDAAAFRSPDRNEMQLAAGKVYHALREAAHAADPTGNTAKADAAYSTVAKRHARGGDILYNTEDAVTGERAPAPAGSDADDYGALLLDADKALLTNKPGEPLRVGKHAAATRLLSRIGDTTTHDDNEVNANLRELGTHGHAGDLADLQAQKDWFATRFRAPHSLARGLTSATTRFAGDNALAIGAKAIDAGQGIKMPGWIGEFEQTVALARARAQAAEAEKRKARR